MFLQANTSSQRFEFSRAVVMFQAHPSSRRSLISQRISDKVLQQHFRTSARRRRRSYGLPSDYQPFCQFLPQPIFSPCQRRIVELASLFISISRSGVYHRRPAKNGVFISVSPYAGVAASGHQRIGRYTFRDERCRRFAAAMVKSQAETGSSIGRVPNVYA